MEGGEKKRVESRRRAFTQAAPGMLQSLHATGVLLARVSMRPASCWEEE